MNDIWTQGADFTIRKHVTKSISMGITARQYVL